MRYSIKLIFIFIFFTVVNINNACTSYFEDLVGNTFNKRIQKLFSTLDGYFSVIVDINLKDKNKRKEYALKIKEIWLEVYQEMSQLPENFEVPLDYVLYRMGKISKKLRNYDGNPAKAKELLEDIRHFLLLFSNFSYSNIFDTYFEVNWNKHEKQKVIDKLMLLVYDKRLGDKIKNIVRDIIKLIKDDKWKKAEEKFKLLKKELFKELDNKWF